MQIKNQLKIKRSIKKLTHGGEFFNIFSVKYLKTEKYIPSQILMKKFSQKNIPMGNFIF